MTAKPDGPALDVERIFDALDRHGVDYLVVGGVSTNLQGALRHTTDFDCLPERSPDNLTRLAAAMRELKARLRVGGLSDEESQLLATQVDGPALGNMELSTWRTDAGDFDVLADIPDRHGQRLRFEALVPRSVAFDLDGVSVRVAALGDVISSKEWADRPKDHEALPELRRLRREELARQERSQAQRRPQPPEPGQDLDTGPGLGL